MLPSTLASRCLRHLVAAAGLTSEACATGLGGSVLVRNQAYSSIGREQGPLISIDRSGLYKAPAHSHGNLPNKEPETQLTKLLKALIRFRGGPITVAEYMSEALTNPTAGYYTQREVFGQQGDFITSPEVSQLFGEMVGIWAMLQWQQLGSPSKLHLVELGPGRGTLMADLLRGTQPFKGFASAVNVHFVEVSEVLRGKQRTALHCEALEGEGSPSNISGLTGAQVRWHRSLGEVPSDAPAIVIAHEFFDALPVHQFQKTERGWCERLVDIAGPESSLHFSMVLAPGATPASKLLVPRRLESIPAETREEVMQLEVSAQSIATAEALAERVADQGGAALVVDYGRDAPYASSLQAIKQHKFVDLLSTPGEADLSCRVDFSALRQGVVQSGADVRSHGPIPQVHFLAGLGIEARLDSLLASSSNEEQRNLILGYNRLIGGTDCSSEDLHEAADAAETEGDKEDSPELEGMGFTYQAMAITASKQPAPTPFPGSGVTFE